MLSLRRHLTKQTGPNLELRHSFPQHSVGLDDEDLPLSIHTDDMEEFSDIFGTVSIGEAEVAIHRIVRLVETGFCRKSRIRRFLAKFKSIERVFQKPKIASETTPPQLPVTLQREGFSTGANLLFAQKITTWNDDLSEAFSPDNSTLYSSLSCSSLLGLVPTLESLDYLNDPSLECSSLLGLISSCDNLGPIQSSVPMAESQSQMSPLRFLMEKEAEWSKERELEKAKDNDTETQSRILTLDQVANFSACAFLLEMADTYEPSSRSGANTAESEEVPLLSVLIEPIVPACIGTTPTVSTETSETTLPAETVLPVSIETSETTLSSDTPLPVDPSPEQGVPPQPCVEEETKLSQLNSDSNESFDSESDNEDGGSNCDMTIITRDQPPLQTSDYAALLSQDNSDVELELSVPDRDIESPIEESLDDWADYDTELGNERDYDFDRDIDLERDFGPVAPVQLSTSLPFVLPPTQPLSAPLPEVLSPILEVLSPEPTSVSEVSNEREVGLYDGPDLIDLYTKVSNVVAPVELDSPPLFESITLLDVGDIDGYSTAERVSNLDTVFEEESDAVSSDLSDVEDFETIPDFVRHAYERYPFMGNLLRPELLSHYDFQENSRKRVVRFQEENNLEDVVEFHNTDCPSTISVSHNSVPFSTKSCLKSLPAIFSSGDIEQEPIESVSTINLEDSILSIDRLISNLKRDSPRYDLTVSSVVLRFQETFEHITNVYTKPVSDKYIDFVEHCSGSRKTLDELRSLCYGLARQYEVLSDDSNRIKTGSSKASLQALEASIESCVAALGDLQDRVAVAASYEDSTRKNFVATFMSIVAGIYSCRHHRSKIMALYDSFFDEHLKSTSLNASVIHNITGYLDYEAKNDFLCSVAASDLEIIMKQDIASLEAAAKVVVDFSESLKVNFDWLYSNFQEREQTSSVSSFRG